MRLALAATLVTTLSLVGCNSLQSLYKSEQKVEQKKVPKLVQPIIQTPLQQVLALNPDLVLELNQVSIQQVFNQVESPTAAQVTVVQAGLMDDSVNAIQKIYQFKRQDTGHWGLLQTSTRYKCQRGTNTEQFQTKLCP